MNHCSIRFSNVQVQASRTLSELTLYIEALRFERWNEEGEPWDLVLIDRGSHTHQRWRDGKLGTSPTDVVVEADLYQDEIDWAWDDNPKGASISVGGSIGVDARPDSFEPGELDELSLVLTCRRDGDSPVEDVTFTDECSGDVEVLDPDWIP